MVTDMDHIDAIGQLVGHQFLVNVLGEAVQLFDNVCDLVAGGDQCSVK